MRAHAAVALAALLTACRDREPRLPADPPPADSPPVASPAAAAPAPIDPPATPAPVDPLAGAALPPAPPPAAALLPGPPADLAPPRPAEAVDAVEEPLYSWEGDDGSVHYGRLSAVPPRARKRARPVEAELGRVSAEKPAAPPPTRARGE